VHRSGSRIQHPLTVQVTDETGKAVQGAAVSFRLPDEGPGGLFANGLRTDLGISDANGRATVRNLQLNGTPGAFQIRITAAKEQARAGTLSRQFSEGTPELKKQSGKNRKWLVVGLVAAGVAGGLGAKMAGQSSTSHPVPAAPAMTIGDPSISVGKP
jgi:hypothetical protein